MLREELERSTHLGEILRRNPDLPFSEGGWVLGEAEREPERTPDYFLSVVGFRLVHCYLRR